MRLSVALSATLLLVACDKGPAGYEPNGPLRTDDAVVNQAANATAEVRSGNAGDLPPAGAGPRFVGKWAADQKSCESAAWHFTDSTLRAPAGGSCSFNRVTEVPGGYDIQATCTIKGAPTSELLKVRFAESAKAMTFDSTDLGHSGLVFCGRDA